MIENDESDCRSDQERQPPAERRIDESGIEQDDRAARAQGRADPEAAVDEEVRPAAQACGDKLLDCRIDGSVFAADAGAGEESEQHETPHIPRQAGGGSRRQINRKRDEKQLLAAPAVGEPAEEKRAKDRAAQVSSCLQGRPAYCSSQAGLCVSSPDSVPASVTSRPSSIQVMPSVAMTSKWNRPNGNASRREAMSVSTMAPAPERAGPTVGLAKERRARDARPSAESKSGGSLRAN